MKRFVLLAVILFVFSAVISTSHSAVKYQIHDLGTLSDGRLSLAYDINNAGQVVGTSGHGFLWSAATGMIDLKTLPGSGWSEARGINSIGDIVGYSWSVKAYAEYGVVWGKTGGMVEFGALVPDWRCYAYKINDGGQIVGHVLDSIGNSGVYAWFWDSDGKMTNIGQLLGSTMSYAEGINNSGQVVGYGLVGNEIRRTAVAYKWNSEQGLILLTPLDEGQYTTATAINEAGQVTGRSSKQYSSSEPVIWNPDGEVRGLGILPGHWMGDPSDINNKGQVVGVCWLDVYTRSAVLWDTDGTIVKLDNLPGGNWAQPQAINDKGEIVGYAHVGGDDWHAVIWTPIPATKVKIDIKPGDDANTINMKSKGTTPAAILGEEDFDVASVDFASVTLAGAPVKLKPNGKPMASYEDVNKDGFTDLLLHFSTQDLKLSATNTTASLTGQCSDGMEIEGTDIVTVR